MTPGSDRRRVYSSEGGDRCPACGRPRRKCVCEQGAYEQGACDRSAPDRRTSPPASGSAAKGGVVRVSRQTGGRRGKVVMVIDGVPLAAPELADLARALKQRCGSGGTVKDGVIEIQGDHRDLVVSFLGERGWTVKRAGG